MRTESVIIALFLLICVTCRLPSTVNDTSPLSFETMGFFESDDISSNVELLQGDIMSLPFFYSDTWHGVPIVNATISVNNTRPDIVEVVSALADQNRAGFYIVAICGKTVGVALLTVSLSKSGYESQNYVVEVMVLPGGDPPPPPSPTYGLPALLLVIICAGLYNRRSKKRRSAEKPDEPSAVERFGPLIEPKDEKEMGEGLI